PSGSTPPYKSDPAIVNLNGMVLLLPHLEQDNLYKLWNPNAAMSNCLTGNDACCPPVIATSPLAGDVVTSGNWQLSTTQLKVFLCPSDVGNPWIPDGSADYSVKVGSGLKGAKSNYDFSALWEYNCNSWAVQQSGKRRMFGENSQTRSTDITDGLSNTVAVCETMLDCLNGFSPAWAYRGWVMTGIDLERGINDLSWGANPGRPGQIGSWGYAGSNHSGHGCNVTMADGSVRFLSDKTDRTLLTRLASMAD